MKTKNKMIYVRVTFADREDDHLQGIYPFKTKELAAAFKAGAEAANLGDVYVEYVDHEEDW